MRRGVWGLIGISAGMLAGYGLWRYLRPQRSPLVFDGSVALIVDAHTPCGEAAAMALAHRGSRLALAGTAVDQLEKLRLQVEPYAADTITIQADWHTSEGRATLVQHTLAYYTHIDIALIEPTDLAGGVLERHNNTRNVRLASDQLASIIDLTAILLTAMRIRRSGALIYCVPWAGRLAAPGMTLVAMAAYGIVGFTDALRHELFNSGITIETVIDSLPAGGAAITVDRALEGLLNNQATVVSGSFRARLLVGIATHLPAGLNWYWRWANSPDWLAETEIT